MIRSLATTLLALSSVSASAIKKEQHPNAICQQFMVSVEAEAPGAKYDIPPVTDDITAVHWTLVADTWSTQLRPDHRVLENITISGTYNIHAQLCVPKTSDRKDILQIATHGGHYDKRYWDSEYKPEDHSYVRAALNAGYSILTYDRLGTGKSDIPDAYTVAQTGLELDILRKLTAKARDGTLVDGMSKPAKIVHVGHSFGSVMTTAFLAIYPNETDAGIVTGFALSQYFGMTGFTSWYTGHAGKKWNRPDGYLVNEKSGIQVVFFGGDPATAFTKEQLDYGDAIKQPIPVGELVSGAQVLGRPGNGLKVPVQYVLPEFDFFVCKGDCRGLVNETTMEGWWPNASDREIVIQPNTGHALPLHNNATAGFQLTFDFLARNGL